MNPFRSIQIALRKRRARMYRDRIPSLQEKKDVDTLVKFLSMWSSYPDEYELLRLDAVDALGKIGDTKALEPLISALNDSNWVATHATQSLGKLRDSRTVEPLISKLHTLKGDAATALGEIGDPRAIQAVSQLEI